MDTMIGRQDAAELSDLIMQAVDDLEALGFERGWIGAAMNGIGTGLVAAHHGRQAALEGLDAARNGILKDENPQ
jgi:hypothetical protein